MTEFKTWATLKENTPFNHLFPDNRIPIVSLLPLVPAENAPSCYIVNAQFLTESQLSGLAEILHANQPDCQSVEQAIAYIRQDLPLNQTHFTGANSTDFAVAASLMSDHEDIWSIEYDPEREERESFEDDDEYDCGFISCDV